MFQPFDTTDERMVNIAMFHIRKDIGRDETFVQALSRNARFVVGDKCFQQAPMFTGNDISLQHIEVGGKKDIHNQSSLNLCTSLVRVLNATNSPLPTDNPVTALITT